VTRNVLSWFKSSNEMFSFSPKLSELEANIKSCVLAPIVKVLKDKTIKIEEIDFKVNTSVKDRLAKNLF
jgi:hypothetical protein